MNGRQICARRVAIWLSPRPTGTALPAGTVLKTTTLFFGPSGGTRGTYVAVELPDRDFGSVDSKARKCDYFANLGVNAGHENHYAKNGIFHQHAFPSKDGVKFYKHHGVYFENLMASPERFGKWHFLSLESV
jgi:hypothetical protein